MSLCNNVKGLVWEFVIYAAWKDRGSSGEALENWGLAIEEKWGGVGLKERTKPRRTGSQNPFDGLPLGSSGALLRRETCKPFFSIKLFLYWNLGFLPNVPPSCQLHPEHLCCSASSALQPVCSNSKNQLGLPWPEMNKWYLPLCGASQRASALCLEEGGRLVVCKRN